MITYATVVASWQRVTQGRERMSQMGTETKLPQCLNNIFQEKKADGMAYVCLYGFLPVLVTIFSLQTHGQQLTAMVYCYFSIFINAAGCIYDGCSRWEQERPCFKNTKLGIMITCTFLVAAYCLFVILSILCLGKPIQWDFLLLVYAIPVFIAIHDLGVCFLRGMVFHTHVSDDQ